MYNATIWCIYLIVMTEYDLPHWKVHAEMNVSICSLEGKYPDELEKEYAT